MYAFKSQCNVSSLYMNMTKFFQININRNIFRTSDEKNVQLKTTFNIRQKFDGMLDFVYHSLQC